MSELAQRVAGLWELAQSEAFSDRREPLEVDVLVAPDGGIRILMDTGKGWALDALRAYHGSETSYRVSHGEGWIKVEGCSAQGSSHSAPVSPSMKWNQLTAGTSFYELLTDGSRAGSVAEPDYLSGITTTKNMMRNLR